MGNDAHRWLTHEDQVPSSRQKRKQTFVRNLCLALSVVSNKAIQKVLFGLFSIHNGNVAVITWQCSVNDLPDLSPLRAQFTRISRLCFLEQNPRVSLTFKDIRVFPFSRSVLPQTLYGI